MATLVYPNLYVGLAQHIDTAMHDVVVNINGAVPRDIDLSSVLEVPFSIKENELLDSEVPRVAVRLGEITERLMAVRKHDPTIIVVCATGREGAPLVAGRYMVGCGMEPRSVIDTLEYIYMTPEQRAADMEYKAKIIAIESGSDYEFTLEETNANAARGALRCLTIPSYRALVA